MKNTLKLVPLCMLAVLMFGCGPSGGAASSPEEIGDAVKDAIVTENFTAIYGYLPAWQIEADKGDSEVKKWRYEEKWELWKPLKEYLETLDPKDKSGIIDEEKWKAATDAERTAVFLGCYKVYEGDKLEDRLGEGMWYMSSRNVELDVEGQGRATIVYANKYKDRIEVKCRRENGLWSLAGVEIEFPKDLPEKPKAD